MLILFNSPKAKNKQKNPHNKWGIKFHKSRFLAQRERILKHHAILWFIVTHEQAC